MPCSACEYDPMGTYQPEIVMNASRFVGFEKDGTPVYISVAEPTDPINILGTMTLVVSGLALGWLTTGAVIGYMKK
jgi:hypothetical protein